MGASNINRVLVTGNLTSDPELRSLPSGMSVCKLRVAVNTRRKGAGGEWEDRPNYFDVTVWGTHGENCARYLSRGRPIAVDGRLEWREWETKEGGKRQAVQIVADTVQFLGGRDDGARSDVPTASTGAYSGTAGGMDFTPASTGSYAPAAAPERGDDDIPF